MVNEERGERSDRYRQWHMLQRATLVDGRVVTSRIGTSSARAAARCQPECAPSAKSGWEGARSAFGWSLSLRSASSLLVHPVIGATLSFVTLSLYLYLFSVSLFISFYLSVFSLSSRFFSLFTGIACHRSINTLNGLSIQNSTEFTPVSVNKP